MVRGGGCMVFNSPFNNISVISWRLTKKKLNDFCLLPIEQIVQLYHSERALLFDEMIMMTCFLTH